MSELNYLRIAQLLGAKLSHTPRPSFGGFTGSPALCVKFGARAYISE
jgi:hypothetical protein